MDNNLIYNEDCIIGLKRLPDNSVDCVLTDPPYMYLHKDQKLDRTFDEDKLFAEFDRIVKPTGFVVIFGRGESFYRWNTKLIGLGFKFKEEVVWDKVINSSPTTPINRFHETISILSKKGSINVCRVPYTEMKKYDIEHIISDVKMIKSALNNPSGFNKLHVFLEDNRNNYSNGSKPIFRYDREHKVRFGATFEKRRNKDKYMPIGPLSSIEFGCKERSIITISRDANSKTIHPTQKPVRLMERLLALTTKQGDLVLDPFCGSCPVGIACVNMDRDFIGWEIDEEYYNGGLGRYEAAKKDKEVANG